MLTPVLDLHITFKILQEASKIKNYSRCSLSPLADSALGKTLQLIDSLRSDVCARVGVSVPVQSWEVGQDKGESSVTINGHTFSELSVSCSNLVQRAAKLEAQLLRSGVSNKKETKLAYIIEQSKKLAASLHVIPSQGGDDAVRSGPA